MPEVTLLQPPAYTEDERRALVDFVLGFKKTDVQEFLRHAELSRSGTKFDLRETIQEALDAGGLTYEKVVAFLDSVAPWGKQHVFLYTGPRGDMRTWKNPDYVHSHLKKHRVEKLFNARLPLILPEKLTLSSIVQWDGKLRVTAVRKHDYEERSPEHDEEREAVAGTVAIILKAYMRHVTRALVAFEWNLNANTAMLQITQLHSDTLYEEVAKEFFGLVGSWLDIEKLFGLVDIRPVIKRLQEIEEGEKPEARSHGIQYRTLRGRRLSAQSPSPRDSVMGEEVIDSAMNSVSQKGVGHLGNFYWLPKVQAGPVRNPLANDTHVYIVGHRSRVNFPTSNSEDVIRYVLHRVRELSRTTP